MAIVSENLARELWGSPAAALGRRFREHYVADAPWWEVVGVAGDVHDDGVDRPPPATVYWPALPTEELQEHGRLPGAAGQPRHAQRSRRERVAG